MTHTTGNIIFDSHEYQQVRDFSGNIVIELSVSCTSVPRFLYHAICLVNPTWPGTSERFKIIPSSCSLPQIVSYPSIRGSGCFKTSIFVLDLDTVPQDIEIIKNLSLF